MLFENGVDAYVVLSDVNRFYFTKIETSFGCAVLNKNKNVYFTDFRYEGYARASLQDWDVKILGGSKLYSELNELLLGLGARRVGFEEEYISVKQFEMLQKNCPEIEFVPASAEFAAQRAIKSEEEISKIANAQIVAQKALAKAINILKPGITERRFAAEILYEMQLLGAEDCSFDTIVAFGENGAYPHHKSGNRKFEKNDVVLVDMGAKVNGYCSDMTRTFCLGQPNEEIAKIHKIVLDAQEYALANIKEGITGHEADSFAREYIKAHGYIKEFGHSLGHGVGVEVHEMPRLATNSPDILKKNMIVTVEPGIYVEGLGGVRIEDFCVVKEDGVLNLTNFNKNLNL